MKTNKVIVLSVLLVLAAGVVMAQDTRGWPPAALLTQYNIAGMSQPAGATDLIWNEEKNVAVLHIRFAGTDNTFTAIKDWLIKNNWVFVEEETYMRDVTLRYEKEGIDFEGDKRRFKMEISFDGRRGYIRSALGSLIWDDD
jgi:hypothetical protein